MSDASNADKPTDGHPSPEISPDFFELLDDHVDHLKEDAPDSVTDEEDDSEVTVALRAKAQARTVSELDAVLEYLSRHGQELQEALRSIHDGSGESLA